MSSRPLRFGAGALLARARTNGRGIRLPLLWTAIALSGIAIPQGLSASVILRVSEEGRVHQIRQVDADIWVLGESGASIVEGRSLQPVYLGVEARVLLRFAGDVLLGTDEGLVRVNGRASTPIFLPKPAPSLGDSPCHGFSRRSPPIYAMAEHGGAVWIGTECGLVEWRDGVATWRHLEAVTALAAGLDLWVATESGIYRLDPATRHLVVVQKGLGIERFDRAGGKLWLIGGPPGGDPKEAYDRLLVVEAGGVREMAPVPWNRTTGVFDVEGEAWFATDAGVFRLLDRSYEPVPVEGLRNDVVNAIAAEKTPGGEIVLWVGTSQRVYRIVGDRVEIFPEPTGTLPEHLISVKEIVPTAGGIWLRCEEGAFRYDSDVSLSVSLSTISVFGQEMFWQREVRPTSYGYRDSRGLDPYGDSGGRIGIALEWDRAELDRALLGDLKPAKDFVEILPYWFPTVYVMGRDEFGNLSTLQRYQGVIFPWSILKYILPIMFWGVFLSLVFVLAPFQRPAMTMLQNQLVRGTLSLGLISGALSFERPRRHVMKRYLRSLRDAANRQPGAAEPVSTGWTDDFLKRLEENRYVAVVGGRAEEVSEALRVLERRLASDREARKRLGDKIPLHLRLAADASLVQQAQRRLENLGDITDPELSRQLVSGGGFVFLIDGAGGSDGEADRAVVEEFLEKFGRWSFIALGLRSGDIPTCAALYDLHPSNTVPSVGP